MKKAVQAIIPREVIDKAKLIIESRKNRKGYNVIVGGRNCGKKWAMRLADNNN